MTTPSHRPRPLATVLLLAGLAALLGSVPGFAADTPEQAKARFDAGDWKAAAAAYESILGDEEAAEDGEAWYRYGYSLYRLERNEDALAAYDRAEALGFTSPRMLASAGICAARLGRDDEALAFLDRAVDAGMPMGPLQATPDLQRFQGQERYQAILAKAEAASYPCRDHAESRQFDFWLGEWRVMVGENQVGTNVITKRLEGCLVSESYTTPRGYAGVSTNFYDPTLPGWRQTWIDTGGEVTFYEGKFENGQMAFRGRTVRKDGTTQDMRMTFTPNDDGTVRQLIESTPDGGETWAVAFDGLYVPTD